MEVFHYLWKFGEGMRKIKLESLGFNRFTQDPKGVLVMVVMTVLRKELVLTSTGTSTVGLENCKCRL